MANKGWGSQIDFSSIRDLKGGQNRPQTPGTASGGLTESSAAAVKQRLKKEIKKRRGEPIGKLFVQGETIPFFFL